MTQHISDYNLLCNLLTLCIPIIVYNEKGIANLFVNIIYDVIQLDTCRGILQGVH